MKNILFYFLTFLSVSAFGQSYLEEIDQDYKNWLKKGEFEKTGYKATPLQGKSGGKSCCK